MIARDQRRLRRGFWPLWRRVIDIATEHYRDHSAHLRRWLHGR
jgi:hypothetical protein